jgi:hypothetical protein
LREGRDNLQDAGLRLFGDIDWRIGKDHIQKRSELLVLINFNIGLLSVTGIYAGGIKKYKKTMKPTRESPNP